MAGPSETSIFGVGAIPEPGPPGPIGPAGPPNVLTIGTVTQGPAAATITGTSPAQILNLVVPQGNQGPRGLPGEPGGSASLGIGTVVSGTPAAATITGVPPNQVLNLTLPKGDQGIPGTSGITSYLYGAGFGFAEGYATGIDLSNGLDIVWTHMHMDPDGLFTGFSGANVIVPAAWNNRWFEFRCNIATQDSAGTESAIVTPTTAQKIVITHARGVVVKKWRASGTGSFTLAGKEVTSMPIQVQTGDVIKVTVYSSSSANPGFSSNSYLVAKPLGLGI